VPYGLFLLVAVAYAVGAAKSAGRGALVQQVDAVESMSNVDVVCTDRTGTLATGRLSLAEVVPLGPLAAGNVERLIGSMARSAASADLASRRPRRTMATRCLPGDGARQAASQGTPPESQSRQTCPSLCGSMLAEGSTPSSAAGWTGPSPGSEPLPAAVLWEDRSGSVTSVVVGACPMRLAASPVPVSSSSGSLTSPPVDWVRVNG
jgi:cation-transporting ATPase E